MPRGRRLTARERSWVLALLAIVAGAVPLAIIYLVTWPQDQWQVDVEVYRTAGVSLATGRPVYDTLTEGPQLLPFTYPPFAAVLALPLAALPFGVVGWLWFWLQVAATTGIVWYAGWRLLQRQGDAAPLALAAMTVPMLYLMPVSEGLRFGQVNAFVVLACLMDLRRPRPLFLRQVPPGVLVGLAMSIKLTPGVFLIHYLVNRRWREAGWCIATAAAATLGTFVLAPQASFAFWGEALQDPGRLGPNGGTSNQSIRGALLRLVGEGAAEGIVWLALVTAAAVMGFALARRAYLRDDSMSEVAAVGLMAVLLSPVAWIHHLHWIVVVLMAVLGATPRRDRARLWATLAVAVPFYMQLPWLGERWLENGIGPRPLAQLLNNSYALLSVAMLALMWWVISTRPTSPDAALESALPRTAPAVARRYAPARPGEPQPLPWPTLPVRRPPLPLPGRRRDDAL